MSDSALLDTDQEGWSWRRWLPIGAAVLVALLVAYVIYRLMSTSTTERKSISQVVTVKLVQPPPPPPPPKPQENPDKPEPKPEPIEKPQPMDKPPPLAAPAAPGPPGPAGPPGVAGLPSGGSPGGIAGGSPGGNGTGTGTGGGNPFGSYAALLQSRVQSAVQRQPALRRTRYRVNVRVWLTPEGAPQRVELVNSLGTKDLDREFRETLLRMARLPQAPPAGMPQPVVLQVNSL